MITSLSAYKIKPWQILVCALPAFILLSFFYLYSYKPELHLDFNAFYQSVQAFLAHKNPYRSLNVNPPIFFILFSPLALFDPHTTYILYSICMAVSLGIAIKWTLQVFAPNLNHKFIFILLLICSYPTITCFKIGQITPLLYLLLIGGYRSYLKQTNIATALLWGLLIALKLFPALLLGYLWQQRAYKLISQTLLASLVFMLLPLLVCGINIYKWYFSLLSQIHWYSHSWNFSLFGLPFKLFFTNDLAPSAIHSLNITALLLCSIGMLGYLALMIRDKVACQAFFLFTTGMMLLLSPLAWQYYMILLFMPLCFLAQHFNGYSERMQACILLAICSLIFPYSNEFIPRENHTLLLSFFYYCLPTFGLATLTLATLFPIRSYQNDDRVNPMSIPVISVLTLLLLISIYTNLSYIKHISLFLISS